MKRLSIRPSLFFNRTVRTGPTRVALVLFCAALLYSAVLCTAALPVSAAPFAILSPALENLAADAQMVKSGLIAADLCFSRTDFERAVGAKVEEITVTALPPAVSGTLFLGSAPVAVNQSVPAESLNLLRFVPAQTCLESSFRFQSTGAYSMACEMKFLTSVNFAPKTEPMAVSALWTQRDISLYGSLSANDPEGDEITFEITRYPEAGLLTLTNSAAGDYKYTPYDGFTGTDAFSYAVRDEYGNYSEEETVSVRVDKPESDLVFADMDEHWAHNAALVMVAENAMDVTSQNGQIFFRPEEKITREDFLVTVMKALGAGEIPPTETGFADNDQISAENRGYIERAYRLGVTNGVEVDGRLCFLPKNEITRAEAAVMLNAILGVNAPDSVPTFADNNAVPAWAKSALYALNSAGVLNGTGSGRLSPSSALSRAETAQILLTIKILYGNE